MKYSFCFICLLFFCVTFSQDLVHKRDIIYAKAANWQNQAKELKLDIIYPPKEKKLPIIVYLHGGSFLDGSKESDSAFCQRLAKSGFVVANVEYRQGYDRSPHLDAVIESRGEEIAVGVERAAAFLASSSRSAAQMRSVYVCGGGARVPGLAEALGKRLKLSVQLANPLANIRVRDGALDGLVTDEIAPLLMLPIGLALRKAA